MVRKVDSENIPPTTKLANTKSKVRGGIQGAARRRRARSSGGPSHPRHAIGQAKQRKTTRGDALNVIPVPAPRSSPEVSEQGVNDAAIAIDMTRVPLPRYLPRPSFRPVAKEIITAFAPELADTPLHYIRRGLHRLGPLMFQVLSGVKAETNFSVLPREMSVVVNDLASDMPTHMLAVYAQDAPANTRRRVTLYPIHNIILAAHCANLPPLPEFNVARPDTPGSSITVPVVPLCLPAPELFSHLSTFLYTKRIDHLLAVLMPCPVPTPVWRADPTNQVVLLILRRFANELAVRCSCQTLLDHTLIVNGLWRNVCALGIDDKELWCALDVAWEVLIHALAISTGTRL